MDPALSSSAGDEMDRLCQIRSSLRITIDDSLPLERINQPALRFGLEIAKSAIRQARCSLARRDAGR
jgi:hypothetical protein